MTAYQHVLFPGHPGFLALHFGNPESTVIVSEMGAGLFVTEGREGIRYPDLLISFNAEARCSDAAQRNYLIPEQGKPPDFVLEVASETTGENPDETDAEAPRLRPVSRTRILALRPVGRLGLPQHPRVWPETGWWATNTSSSRSTGRQRDTSGATARC